MKNITISWQNEYSKTVSYYNLAEAIVLVYIDTYGEIPTMDDLNDFIWEEESLYDYADDLLEYLFPYYTDSNCSYTKLLDLDIEKNDFYEYLEIAINNVFNSSGDN